MAGNEKQRRQQAFFANTSHDLHISYETNFAASGEGSKGNQTSSGTAPAPPPQALPKAGTPLGVESVIVATVYRKIVTQLVDKASWLKQAENVNIYTDVRSLMHYVKTWHGGVFRLVVLNAMLESAKKLVRTQYKIEADPTTG